MDGKASGTRIVEEETGGFEMRKGTFIIDIEKSGTKMSPLGLDMEKAIIELCKKHDAKIKFYWYVDKVEGIKVRFDDI